MKNHSSNRDSCLDVRRLKGAAALLTLLLLVACGPEKPLVDDAQIDAARQSGTLEALFDDLSRSNAEQRAAGRSSERGEALLHRIGEELATNRVNEIHTAISQNQLANGLSTMTQIEQLRKQAASVEKWSAALFGQVSADLDQRAAKSSEVIATLRSDLNSLPADRFRHRLAVLEEVAILEGTAEAHAAIEQEKQNYVTRRATEARAMIAAGNFNQALALANELRALDPDNARLKETISEAQAGSFVEQFQYELQHSNPEGAYDMLLAQPNLAQLQSNNPDLEPATLLLADYFADLGSTENSNKRYLEAYHNFQKARKIRRLFNPEGTIWLEQESAFLNAVFQLSSQADAQGLAGLKLGYLEVIAHSRPDFPGLGKTHRNALSIVTERAVKRVSTASFRDAVQGRSFGDRIAAGVTQHLFQAIPNDIRIVERDELTAIIREREIESQEVFNVQKVLVAADYLIQGTILEAGAEQTDKQGRRTARVVTGMRSEANPAHLEWQENRRRKDPEPPETIEVPIEEDISYGITQHRKTAIVSGSYRLVDANTAKVLKTNTITRDSEVTGESSEGVQLGSFELPLVLADLPADLVMLNALADQVSEKIGEELAATLSMSDRHYQTLADAAAGEGNFAQAAEQMANALALRQRKELNSEEVRSKLIEYALNSGL